MESAQLQMVELGRLTMREWAHLVAGEPAPFGETCSAVEFRPKDHHVAIRDGDGTLLAAGGWTIVTVEVDSIGSFDVIGLGALIVRHEARGAGLARPIIDRLTEITGELGYAHRVIFCEPHLEQLYERQGYRALEAPVWVDQPTGPLLWPLLTMWSPTDPRHEWPTGTVTVHGLPF